MIKSIWFRPCIICKVWGIKNDEGIAIATGTQGNIYVGGTFMGTASFGPVNITSAGGKDVFIAKYTTDGDLIWAKNVASGLYDEFISYISAGMKLDQADHIYITGGFGGGQNTQANFGNITLTSPSRNSGIFVAKYDTSGNVIWAKSAGGAEGGDGINLAIDRDFNVYAVGYYNAPNVYFDSIKIVTASGGVGFGDMFLVKYDSTGKALWARGAGGNITTGAGGIFIDKNQNAVIAGGVSSNITHF